MTLDPHDKESLLKALDQLRTIVEQLDSRKSCLTCVSLRDGVCEKWCSKPPADYIKVGCDQWVFDKNSAPF